MCHSVDPFPLKTRRDQSGWNRVHSVPMDLEDFSYHKKIPGFTCANISSRSSLEISILPNHSGAFMPF